MINEKTANSVWWKLLSLWNKGSSYRPCTPINFKWGNGSFSDVPLNQVANVGVEDSRTFNRLNVQWYLQLIKQFVFRFKPYYCRFNSCAFTSLETRRDMQKVARSEAENAIFVTFVVMF